jgi:hypothetical protein
LPFTGKEIVDFPIQNKAWYIVENALQVIIKENLNNLIKDEDEIVRKLDSKARKIYEEIMASM